MKCILFALTFSLVALSQIASAQQADTKLTIKLISRFLPKHAESFVCETIPKANGSPVFEVEAKNGKIVLRGSDGVSLASAFNWYLKHVAKCQVSERGDQLKVPSQLPKPKAKIRKVSPYQTINHFNYCTFCYTAAFWNWERWEREIDTMAMSGIRNPLMVVGNEKVWQNVMKKLGFSDQDIAAFIPSSAFTAWWLMGNLEGEGGPLTQRLIDQESDLAKKILARMRSYGMEPVLQGFCGVVPTTLGKYLPGARIVDQGRWAGGYQRPSVLSPLDPQFEKVAGLWYQEHYRLYGKAKFYGGDLFHEGGITAGLDLAECAKAVQREMRKNNPEATWVLQGWSGNPPRKLLLATEPDHTLVEYLQSYPPNASIQDYAGRRWTFTWANTFGGHETLGGSLKGIAAFPSVLLNKNNNRNVGFGVLDEGLDTNPAVYDLLSDVAWEQKNVNLKAWARDYAIRRYGAEDKSAVAFWRIMAEDLLGNESENLLCAWPRFGVRSTSSWGDTTLKHDRSEMLQAGRLLFACADKYKDKATYKSDCIEAMRQLFNDYGAVLYGQLTDAYDRKDSVAFKSLSDEFLQLIADNDKLFSSGEFTLLGKWIADARAKGSTKAEKDLMERSARQLVTLWTPKPTDLTDYAYRHWGGLFRDYYEPRWKNFLGNALKSLEDGQTKAEFNQADALVAWVKSTSTKYPSKPEHDSVETAHELFKKYETRFAKGVEQWKAMEVEAKLWHWSLADSNETVQTLSWDLTRKVQNSGPGKYSVRIEYQRGNKAIVIQKVSLLRKTAMAVNGEVISVDEHPGRSGVVTKDNVYTVDVKSVEPDAQYILQADASGDGGNDSFGRIVIEKK